MTPPTQIKAFSTLFAVLIGSFPPALMAASPLFEVLDRDGSGDISLKESEAAPQVHLNFGDLDENRNGQLEEAELQLSGVQLSFEHLDADGDLAISYDEASALPRLARQFNQLDKNNDQALTPGEFESFANKNLTTEGAENTQ